MRTQSAAVWVAMGLLLVAPALAQDQGRGQAIVTVLPAGTNSAIAELSLQDLKLKVSGKSSTATSLTPLRGTNGRLELILLIDSSTRISLGTQLGVIGEFIREMPSGARMAVAYMTNGKARLARELSSDPAMVASDLHVPGQNAGSSGSPYFCLSDLAHHWPSQDGGVRREVVMITDGVDDYAPQYDPDDPYVLTAIKDSVRARLVVYAMYWSSRGPSAAETGIVTGRTAAENAMDTSFAAIGAGQNLLQEVTDATGGLTYWQGMGNPVSFDPFFADLRRRLQNQYLLRFDSRLEKATAVESLKVQMTAPGKITAPHQVFVESTGGAAQ